MADPTTDAARLDWLERQDLNDLAVIRQTNGVVGLSAGRGPYYGRTLREAIDKARGSAEGSCVGCPAASSCVGPYCGGAPSEPTPVSGRGD